MADAAVIMTGRVFKIVSFGAFVRLSDGSAGLVHISEISDGFVQDVQDFLEIGTEVKVAVLSTEADGRRKLSIKRVKPQPRLRRTPEEELALSASREEKKRLKKQQAMDKTRENKRSLFMAPPEDPDDTGAGGGRSFEDKLAKFMKDSEERQVDVKRQTDHKRGGGYVRKG